MVEVNVELNKDCPYVENYFDHLVPGLVWEYYALPKTEEILVVATYEGNTYSLTRKSELERPSMGERFFGMDTQDFYMAEKMCFEIANYMMDKDLVARVNLEEETAYIEKMKEENKGKISLMSYYIKPDDPEKFKESLGISG